MGTLTHHMILNSINYAYIKAVGADLTKFKAILIHFHDTSEVRAMELTLKDFPDAKWIIPTRHPVAYFHSDVESYNNKSRTLSWFLHNGFDKIDPVIFQNIKPIGNRANYIKLSEIHKDLRGTMQKLSIFLGVSFSETMLKSTFGNIEYASTTENNQYLSHQPKDFTDSKYKDSFSYQDIRFLETTFRQAIKKFNYEFETDAKMSREELLLFPSSKIPGFFTKIRTNPRVTHLTLFLFKKRYLIVRMLDKLGLARIFLIVKGQGPTNYTETRSESELTKLRTNAIDENIKFNSISWI